jgi:hypothetical protein
MKTEAATTIIYTIMMQTVTKMTRMATTIVTYLKT